MPSPETCRARAAEADRLASLVSYERDRARLRDQARAWRERAAALEAAPAAAPEPPAALIDRVRRWLKGPAGR